MKLSEVLLIESREDFIAGLMGDKILSAYDKDTFAQKNTSFKTATEVLRHISKNTNKKYIQWLAKQYAGGKFKLEDLSRVKSELNKFEKVKNKLDNKDINQFDSLAAFRDTLDQFADEDIKSNKEIKREEYKKLFDDGDAEYFFKGKTLDVVIPHTEEASCELGKGTKWCTAATEYDNMFHEYNNSGPLHIVRTRDGRKFQFHFETMQFMDERDSEVSLHELRKQYPELDKAFKDVVWFKSNPSKDELIDVIERDPETALNMLDQKSIPKDVLKHAVTAGTYLGLVDDALKTDELERAAVRSVAFNIQHVRKQTPELIELAMAQSDRVIQLIEKPSVELMQRVIAANPFNINFLAGRVPMPQELIDKTVSRTPGVLANSHVRQLASPEVVKQAVISNIDMISYMNPWQHTPEIVMAATKHNPRLLRFVNPKLITPEVLVAAVSNKEIMYIEQIPSRQITPEIALAAVKTNGEALDFIPTKLHTDELVLTAIANFSSDYSATSILRRTPNNSPRVVEAAIKRSPINLHYVTNPTLDHFKIAFLHANSQVVRYGQMVPIAHKHKLSRDQLMDIVEYVMAHDAKKGELYAAQFGLNDTTTR